VARIDLYIRDDKWSEILDASDKDHRETKEECKKICEQALHEAYLG